MNRIGSGISEGDELAESAGRRGKLSFALPSKTHVHGVNFVIYRLKIDAMSWMNVMIMSSSACVFRIIAWIPERTLVNMIEAARLHVEMRISDAA